MVMGPPPGHWRNRSRDPAFFLARDIADDCHRQ
jgi:hypothetical protein